MSCRNVVESELGTDATEERNSKRIQKALKVNDMYDESNR